MGVFYLKTPIFDVFVHFQYMPSFVELDPRGDFLMRKFGLMLAICMLVTVGFARPASAIMQFHKEFIKLYVGDDANPESDLAKLIKDKKKKCLVCHQGKKKKNRNPYGEELSKLLDKKKDKKDIEKIVAALKKVEAMPSNPDDSSSKTYGEILAAGELPGGSMEDLQKEPESGDEG